MMDGWQDRLRQAVERSGKKRSILAMDAGIAPETLSRILNGHRPNVPFETIVRIAHAAEETVGWVLDERGYTLSSEDLKVLQRVGDFMDRLFRQSGHRS